MTRIRWGLALLTVTLCSAPNETKQVLESFEAVEPHMGTLFRIKLYAGSEAQARTAFHSAFERVRQLDEILSDYRADSELSRATQAPIRKPVKVGKDLFRILHAAQDFAEQSGGAFDITLGPLTHLWRIDRKKGIVPDADRLRFARERCGYRKMHLDSRGRTVMVDVAGMQFDAGGIAKGYAADEALVVLRGIGISRALVAASGDLAFGDPPPGKRGWRIGIDSLDSAGQPFTRILIMANSAVSTSGNTEQHLDANGKRYSHILDGRTGMALTTNLTVTVAALNGIEADAAATALSVLGTKEGLALAARRPGMEALLIDRSVSPAAITASPGFVRMELLNKN